MRQFLLLFIVLFMINTAAQAQILSKKDWKEGCYYDLQGNKITGLIYSQPPVANFIGPKGDHILYKKDQKDSRQNISSDSITAYVMGVDSFTTTHLDNMRRKPFLHVVLNGTIKLYYSTVAFNNAAYMAPTSTSSTSTVPTPSGNLNITTTTTRYFTNPYGGGGTKTNYYYGPDPEHLTELNRKSFIDVMSLIMADKPQTVAMIKDKTFTYGSLDDLINYYKR